jgi:hypothetical protein
MCQIFNKFINSLKKSWAVFWLVLLKTVNTVAHREKILHDKITGIYKENSNLEICVKFSTNL